MAVVCKQRFTEEPQLHACQISKF